MKKMAAWPPASRGWQNFRAADFQRLKSEFGVTWVILSRANVYFAAQNQGEQIMTCPYENAQVKVCRLY